MKRIVGTDDDHVEFSPHIYGNLGVYSGSYVRAKRAERMHEDDRSPNVIVYLAISLILFFGALGWIALRVVFGGRG